jgi:hypothetical protein
MIDYYTLENSLPLDKDFDPDANYFLGASVELEMKFYFSGRSIERGQYCCMYYWLD